MVVEIFIFLLPIFFKVDTHFQPSLPPCPTPSTAHYPLCSQQSASPFVASNTISHVKKKIKISKRGFLLLF